MGDDIDEVTKNKIATIADSALERFASGKDEISGNNLLNAKNWIADAVRRGDVTTGTVEERALRSGVGAVEDMVDKSLPAS